METKTPRPQARIVLTDLFELVKHPKRIPWQSFEVGVEIYRLYGDGKSGPGAALIRFAKGGCLPAHRHMGFEHLLILSGSQEDEIGVAHAGTLVINPPGTVHSVVSKTGCIALGIYEKAVAFLDPVAN